MMVTWWCWWWRRQYSQTFIVVAELLSCVQLFVTPWTAAHQAFMSFTISRSLLTFISIESVILSNQLNFCCPLLFCLQSFSTSGSFPMSQLFASGGQSIEALASASVLPMRWWRIKITMKKMTVKCWSGWWWWQYSDVYWAHTECQVIVSEPNLPNFTCSSKQALWIRYLCGFCL